MSKINEKHKVLYTSQKRYVYEKGGRGSGKSYAVSDYALRLTYDTNRVVLFLRYTMIAASISIVPEFENQMITQGCSDDFYISGSEITNKKTGSKIIFKGVKTSSLNQTANLKSIQGLTDVIYDEFEEHPDQETFDKLDESIRSVIASNKIVLVSNALHKESWQYKQFFESNGLYYSMTERVISTWRDNFENLSESWHQKRLIVKEKNRKKYDRDFEGIDYEDIEGALWNYGIIKRVSTLPEMKKIVIPIDPAVTSDPDSDEHGILACGLGYDGNGYIFDDVSGIYTPNGMAEKSIGLYHKWSANLIIGEANNGGDFIEAVIKSVDKSVGYKKVHASRGKVTRAEPIVNLYEQGKVFHYGNLNKLEIEYTTWNPTKNKSPNRLDAAVWGLTELMLHESPTFDLWLS
jgi:phage terminase large subunit-like protein